MSKKNKKKSYSKDFAGLLKYMEKSNVKSCVIVLIAEDGSIVVGSNSLDEIQTAALLREGADLMNVDQEPRTLH